MQACIFSNSCASAEKPVPTSLKLVHTNFQREPCEGWGSHLPFTRNPLASRGYRRCEECEGSQEKVYERRGFRDVFRTL